MLLVPALCFKTLASFTVPTHRSHRLVSQFQTRAMLLLTSGCHLLLCSFLTISEQSAGVSSTQHPIRHPLRHPSQPALCSHWWTTSVCHVVCGLQVSAALREGRPVEPESFDCVTIFFSDIVGFKTMSTELPPQEACATHGPVSTLFCQSVLTCLPLLTLGFDPICCSLMWLLLAQGLDSYAQQKAVMLTVQCMMAWPV